MFVSNQQFEFISSTWLLMHSVFKFLQRSLYLGGFISIFLLKLMECEVIHLLLDEHQYFVDLFDEIHLLDHFSLLHLLHI